MSIPPPPTATEPLSSQPIWAAASMPRATPEIPPIAPAHARRSQAVERRQFRLGLARRQRRGRTRPLVIRWARQRVERRARRAEAAQQGIEGDRPDRFGAAEAQPVQALLRIELARG